MAEPSSSEGVPTNRRQTDEKDVFLEVCIDNLISAVEAERGGAGRIELCSSLAEGGLTPSCGFLKVVKRTVKIPVFVMIRPRGGDFVYSPEELEIMKEDIKTLLSFGADGFVFGCLTSSDQIDQTACRELISLCGEKPATFHRAFDLTHSENRLETLETIVNLGFKRILSSGQHKTALLGKDVLRELVDAAKDRIIIMPGAGITADNVNEIIRTAGVKEFHGSASKILISKMSSPTSRNVSMGASEQDDKIKVTDSQIVAKLVENARRA